MKKGQRTDFKKEVFQTGLTERSRGGDALRNFLGGGQAKRQRLNIVRKKKK